MRWGAQNLPYGVSFDEITGTFSGTPEESGSYTIPVTVETNYGVDVKNVNINVKNNTWVANTIPKINNIQFVSSPHTYRMYYSDNEASATSYSGQCLMIPLRIQDTYTVHILGTKDLTKFMYNSKAYLFNYSSIGGSEVQDYCYNSRTGQILSIMGYKVITVNAYNQSVVITLSASIQNYIGGLCAICYSPTLNIILVSDQNGNMLKIRGIVVQDNGTIYRSGIKVNEACLKWSEDNGIFCLTGSDGTAISTDGENWTKNTETAPKDLVELVWRNDLGKFFARSTDEKIFYVSNDGLNWEQFNNTPIPLEAVKGVRYSKELGKYCAFPSSGQYVYFSKDLENWEQSDVAGGEIEIADLIYFPPVNKWVCMPSSGTTYYTLEE